MNLQCFESFLASHWCFFVAGKASALVLLKSVREMSAELLFADTIAISGKKGDTPLPIRREGFCLWP